MDNEYAYSLRQLSYHNLETYKLELAAIQQYKVVIKLIHTT